MANIALTVKTNFAAAGSEIKAFGALTESEAKRIEKFQSSFKSEKIDSFIQKNQRAAAAVEATRGPLQSAAVEQAGLRREIERLIKGGLDPESEALQKLQTEYTKATEKVEIMTKAEEINKNMTKNTAIALGVTVTAISAFIGYTVSAASKIEDLTAAFTPLTGSVENAEKFVSQLNETAASTPFQLDAISASAKQLLPALAGDTEEVIRQFNMLGDTAGGNAQKLDSITRGYSKALLKNKVDMESLNMIAEAGVPIYTELADSMGVTVEEMTAMSSAGEISADDLTDAFERMTGEGGLFFNGMQIASQTLTGRISTLKDNFNLTAAALGQTFLPLAKDFIDWAIEGVKAIGEFVSDQEKLNSVLDLAIPILSGVIAGLTGFLIITSIQKLIEGFSIAVGVMNAVLAANPLILVAAGLAALTVAVVGVTRAVKSNIEEMSQMSEIAGLTVGEVDQLTVAMETLSHEQLAGASFTTAAEDIATMAENLGVTEEQAIRVGLAGEHITDQYKEQLQVLLDQIDNQNVIDELSSTNELRQERILRLQEDRADEEVDITTELQRQQDIIDNNTSTEERRAEIVRQLLVWQEYYNDGLIDEQAMAEKHIELRQALVNEIMAAGVEQDGLTASQITAIEEQQDSVKFWQDQVDLMEAAKALQKRLADEIAALNPNLTEGNRIHEQIYQNLKYEVEQAENLGEVATESAEQTKLTWSETMTKIKDKMEELEGVINATFTALEQSTQGFNEDSLEAVGDLVLEIGKAAGSTEAIIAGLVIKITAQIISLFDGIDQKAQEFQQGLTDLENSANLQRLSNRQDILDQEYLAEIASIDATLQAKLEAAGLADKTAAESIQAKLDAAIAANDIELTAELEKEKKKQAIIDKYTQQKIDAEDDYNKASRLVAYETAVINRDIAIAQAKIDQQAAISDLGWFNKDKKADVNALYSDLISSISSIPLPALQTGTGPMGVVSSSSRADSNIVKVSEGEKITPRGEGQSITVNNIINEQLLYSITQKGIDSNQITITTDNIRTA